MSCHSDTGSGYLGCTWGALGAEPAPADIDLLLLWQSKQVQWASTKLCSEERALFTLPAHAPHCCDLVLTNPWITCVLLSCSLSDFRQSGIHSSNVRWKLRRDSAIKCLASLCHNHSKAPEPFPEEFSSYSSWWSESQRAHVTWGRLRPVKPISHIFCIFHVSMSAFSTASSFSFSGISQNLSLGAGGCKEPSAFPHFPCIGFELLILKIRKAGSRATSLSWMGTLVCKKKHLHIMAWNLCLVIPVTIYLG